MNHEIQFDRSIEDVILNHVDKVRNIIIKTIIVLSHV